MPATATGTSTRANKPRDVGFKADLKQKKNEPNLGQYLESLTWCNPPEEARAKKQSRKQISEDRRNRPTGCGSCQQPRSENDERDLKKDDCTLMVHDSFQQSNVEALMFRPNSNLSRLFVNKDQSSITYEQTGFGRAST